MARYGKFVAMSVAFLLSAVCLVGTAQEPKKDGPRDGKKFEGKGFQKGGFGGFGGRFGGATVGQVLPTFLQDTLKLNDDQKKQVESLQKDVDAKLAKILTEDQQKQLKDMRERRPGQGGFGGGGFGRPGGGRPGPNGEPKKKDN